MGILRRLRGSGSATVTGAVEIITIGADVDAMSVVDDDARLVEIDVVGESHRQDALERIAGPKTELGKRHRVGVTLRCDPANGYDPNAIRVECMGQHLGFVPREAAAELAPAMLARAGFVIEGVGFIVGGWDNGESVGSYGVRVWISKESLARIGVHPDVVRREVEDIHGASSALDTGFSQAWATDEADESYDLAWYRDLPEGDRPAIATLRQLLERETDPIDRHFQFTALQERLYRCRTVFDSALDEYDAACGAHDAEMPTIRVALVAKWGKVPRLALYRQMAIRHSKQKNWNAALWWSERGLAIYGADAANESVVDDLRKRSQQSRAKLEPPTTKPRTRGANVAETARREVEHLICQSCGATFERVVVKGRKPHFCSDCRVADTRPAETAAIAAAPVAPRSAPTPPAWFPDPSGKHQHRYFDGTRWTEHVATNGVQSTDAP